MGSSPNYPTKVLAQLEERQFAKLEDAGSSPGTPFFFRFKVTEMQSNKVFLSGINTRNVCYFEEREHER